MSSFTSFRREAWIEYGIGVFVLLVRFFARWRIVGLKGWQGDDYFALLVLIFWTVSLSLALFFWVSKGTSDHSGRGVDA